MNKPTCHTCLYANAVTHVCEHNMSKYFGGLANDCMNPDCGRYEEVPWNERCPERRLRSDIFRTGRGND